MSPSPVNILESVALARSTMVTLHGRTTNCRSIDDLAELSVPCTTVRKIEESLQVAAEYDDVLTRQLARTNARIAGS